MTTLFKNFRKEPNEKPIETYTGDKNEEGLMHGQGTLVNHQTNTSYKGNWVNGIREGFGEQTFPTGEIYRGDWKAGAMDGEGMVLYPNQDRFQGHWENGNRVKGSFLMKNSGIIFKENWIQDTPGGYGQIEFNSGGRYVGEVKCTPFGKHQIKNFYIFRDGFGEMYYSNNTKYIGFWKNDKRKGFGMLVNPNGSKYYGHWQRGKKSGAGLQIETDGTFHEGQYHDEKKGTGKLFIPSGDIVHGEWNANNNKEIKLNSAIFIPGKFTDTPRPMRTIYLSQVTGIQRAEDSSLYTTSKKWQGLVNETMENLVAEHYPVEKILDTLGEAKEKVKFEQFVTMNSGNNEEDLSKPHCVSPDPLREVINRFLRIFKLAYGSTSLAKKEYALFQKQTAIDDVNSFASSVMETLRDRLNLNSQQKKIYELLLTNIFSQIYHILFPLYVYINYNKDQRMASKIEELSEVTPATIGVKPAFHLQNLPPSPVPQQDAFLSPSQSVRFSRSITERAVGPKVLNINLSRLSNDVSAEPGVAQSKSARGPNRMIDQELNHLSLSARNENKHTIGARKSKPSSAKRYSLQVGKTKEEFSEDLTTKSEVNEGKKEEKDKEELGKEGKEGKEEQRRSVAIEKGDLNAEASLKQVDSEKIDNVVETKKIEDVVETKKTEIEEEDKKPEQILKTEVLNNTDTPETNLNQPQTETKTQSQEQSQTPRQTQNQSQEQNQSLDQTKTQAHIQTPVQQEKPQTTIQTPVQQEKPQTPKARERTSRRTDLPYQRVIDALKKLETSITPNQKVNCLTSAAKAILTCVDEANPNKSKQIVMGAEDKFPVLIYAIVRANVPHLWSHSYFIQDFLVEHYFDEESRYRISEFFDALKYIQNLDWDLRDGSNVLFPMKMVISSVTWNVKGVFKLKFEDESTAESQRINILLILSHIFRMLSQRLDNMYSPYLIPVKLSPFIKSHENFFMSVFKTRELGLNLRCEDEKYWIDFDLKHPSYLYEKLSVACVYPENEDDM